MTAGELYRLVRAQLLQAGIGDAAFDAGCLMEDIGGVPKSRFLFGGDTPLPPDRVQAVRAAADRRAAGYPLQYLLGEWAFLGLRLQVGEGVLIPRPDTEVLCETAARLLSAAFPDEAVLPVLDLCAGTGCVGLGTASLCPRVQPTCVELSDRAFAYLTANLKRYPRQNGCAVQADIRTMPVPPARYAALLSNPPYIPTDELSGLMREVQQEPVMALDGSADGLAFYRVIAERWLSCLRPGGLCAVEVGAGQAEAVEALFAEAGLTGLMRERDAAGIERVVAGFRP